MRAECAKIATTRRVERSWLLLVSMAIGLSTLKASAGLAISQFTISRRKVSGEIRIERSGHPALKLLP